MFEKSLYYTTSTIFNPNSTCLEQPGIIIETLEYTPLNLNETCSIIFVIFTCFHLMNFFGEEKFSWLPIKKKVADENTIFSSNVQF